MDAINIIRFQSNLKNMRNQQKPFESLSDLLGFYYHREDDFNEKQFWYEVVKTISPYPNSLDHLNRLLIPQLQTSELFLREVYHFLQKLPYNDKIKKIIKLVTEALDPSYCSLKIINSSLIKVLQEEQMCISELNLSLTTLKVIFQNQSPLNENAYSCIYLAAPEEGIQIKNSIKWPFEKGGTLAFWFNMSEHTKQCKIFQFLNQEKCGFEIIMKNKKIYIQKVEEIGKFRLIKNNSTFLCEAVYNKDVKLCVQFEIRKKFFQPFFSINIIMNNFVMNGVELDSFQINKHDFQMKIFKGFSGKFYSALILTQKLANQVQQINGQKGFTYESDIRNFNYLFDEHMHTVLMLLSCSRSVTYYSEKNLIKKLEEEQEEEAQLHLIDELQEQRKEDQFSFCGRPQSSIIYDAIKQHTAIIDHSAFCNQNLSIKKQIGFYGGFTSFIPYLHLLQINMCDDEVYSENLNNYLDLIKTMFCNKIDSIEQANKINYFSILASFINKTKMRGFNYQTISKLKEIYLSLNSRPIREKYFKEVVWGIDFPKYLPADIFLTYIKFLKTFYNEDIDGSIFVFGINSILQFIRNQLDHFLCCSNHVTELESKNKKGLKYQFVRQYNEWHRIYEGMFEIIQNIFIVERNEAILMGLIEQFISGISFTVSPCYIENSLLFLENMFKKDLLTFKIFSECMIASNCEHYLCFFKALSCCTSEVVKAKLISFLLRILGATLIDQSKKQKQMLSLCIKYHPRTANTGCNNSSRKSQQNRDSLDYSQDKLSLNSLSVQKFITISPLKTLDHPIRKQSDFDNDESPEANSNQKRGQLLDHDDILKVLVDWTFSETMIESLPEDIQNPGLFILMELYKGATYKIRLEIVRISVQKIEYIRFGPELMAWAIQALMVAVFDIASCAKESQQIIEETINHFLTMISNYHVQEQQEQTELSIIKLVFSSVKSKYPQQITRMAANKTFFMICSRVLSNFVDKLRGISQNLKQAEHSLEDGHNLQEIYKTKQKQFEVTAQKGLQNCFTFITEYFILKGDQNQFQYEEFMEELVQVAEQEAQLTLEIGQKIFQILVMSAGPGDHKIIDENYAQKNHQICDIIFRDKVDREKDKNKQEPKLLQLIFFALQNSFESFEDMNIDWRKRNLNLIKKYLVYMIELTENSGSWKIQHYEEEINAIFLNVLSFFQQKFSQYYYYPFERHKNLNISLESKIRKNIQDLKRTLFSIFVELIELVQYIDSKGSMQHKSFYELMKPKRKAIHKFHVKNIYPVLWKKADMQIFEFMSLSKEKLNQDAQQKLQSHIAEKRISIFSSGIEKVSAKKLNNFIKNERKGADERQKKSISYYKIVESQKCKIFVQSEQQITLFRIKLEEEEKIKILKNKQQLDKIDREINYNLNEIWNINRTYQGLWANPEFYAYAQGKGLDFKNYLQKFYEKKRASRFDKNFTTPLIEVVAKRRSMRETSSIQRVYANEIFLEGSKNSKMLKPRGSERIKIGLQFIKRKVIDRLIKKVSNKEGKDSSGEKQNSQGETNVLFENVLWIKPMKVFSGYLKVETRRNILSFCHSPTRQYEHISLMKPELESNQLLIKQWQLDDIEGFKLKKFFLKPIAIQIYFKYRKSIMFVFPNSNQRHLDELAQMIEEKLQRRNNKGEQKEEKDENWWDKIKKFQIEKKQHQELKAATEKWLRYEMTNFEYLMFLNMESGRSNEDLNQYPIFPWIYSKYNQTKFKKKQEKYRPMNKNMGSLGSEERYKKFIQNFKNIQQSEHPEFPVPHHYGFHYSNLPTVLYYLIRVNPYSQGAKYLQGGKFDVADRLFSSIPNSFKNVITETSDIRELIPQFFYFPEFLVNYDEHQFGDIQEGNKRDNFDRKVHHVELPNGCMNAFDFIENHREALESPQISKHLNEWIDLIFGYKSSGKEAEKAMNTYHYLTNEENVEIIQKMLVENKEAIQSQMAFYGKTPTQLFSNPHPEKPEKPNDPYFQDWTHNKFEIQLDDEMIEQQKEPDKISVVNNVIIFQKKSKSGEQEFILVYENGSGCIFRLSQKGIDVIKKFHIQYKSYERIQIMDHSVFEKCEYVKFPAAVINFDKIAIGAMFGGRILVYNILRDDYEMLSKNLQTVLNLAVSNQHQNMLSCSIHGQLVKWHWTKHCETQYSTITSQSKTYLHSQINSLSIDDKMKIILASSQDGCLHILCLERLDKIRTIKLHYAVKNSILLRYPYYLLYIECEKNHQYCFSINGSLLDESELQQEGSAGIYSELGNISLNGYKQRVLKIDHKNMDIMAIAMPDFEIQGKLTCRKKQKQSFKKQSSKEQMLNNRILVDKNKRVLLTQGKNIYSWSH